MNRALAAALAASLLLACSPLAAQAAGSSAKPTRMALAGSGEQLAQIAPDASQTQVAAPVGQLTPQQVETLGRVSTSFNKVDQLAGDFVQVGPDGARTEGKFALSKPGKIRFTYAAPSRIDVISDGSSVAVRDRKLATQDIWPLSQTPLRFLLQSRIDLLRDANVVAVYTDADMVSVVLEEKSTLTGNSRLTLMFGASDYALKQWTVTDAQGADTSVAIYNLDTQAKLDPKLFTIDFRRLQGGQ
jgi:outer membrane lipoprotein-sorting protein